ncbi:hypothetical protein ABZ897_27415 [Nonomuraea sp. NPDC046802]|uniref:hypothetical protein n=1 Tax=Nonomuraea sp. NPDC046802 TaxID=3154919 RepID=UPI0033F783E6
MSGVREPQWPTDVRLSRNGGLVSREVVTLVTAELTADQLTNLERAATDLEMSMPQVLALLAGRVQVESAGRLRLANADTPDGEGR